MHDNDLFDLLMSGKQVPQGRYNHATWDVLSNGDLVSNEALVTAYLARERKEYKAQLGELVNNSRIGHEMFATYASLLLVIIPFLLICMNLK